MATRVLPSPVFISAIVPAVEDDAADELDVEVPHVEHAAAGLADDREGLGQEVVQGLALGDALPELRGLGRELRRRESGRSAGSSAPIRWTSGRMRLISRSFFVPMILVRMVFSIVRGLNPDRISAGRQADQALSVRGLRSLACHDARRSKPCYGQEPGQSARRSRRTAPVS